MRLACVTCFKLVLNKLYFLSNYTEIEEKEDAMTKLYKQLDLKNIEVLKYKSQAEKAKVRYLRFLSLKVNRIVAL